MSLTHNLGSLGYDAPSSLPDYQQLKTHGNSAQQLTVKGTGTHMGESSGRVLPQLQCSRHLSDGLGLMVWLLNDWDPGESLF